MEELSETDELYLISEATNDDGTVDVELHSFHKTGTDNRVNSFHKTDADNRVSVKFTTPTGDVKREVMDWPDRDSDEYKFVRTFEQAGYSIISAEEACKNGATVKASTENWNIIAPPQNSLRERAAKKISDNIGIGFRSDGDETKEVTFPLSVLMFPMFAPLMVVVYSINSNVTNFAAGYGMALWDIIVWLGIIVALVMLL